MYIQSVSKLLAALCLSFLLSYSAISQAVVMTLDANGTSFQGNLLTGTSNIGVLFFHGRGASFTGNYVRQVGEDLNQQGYTTFSLANPEPFAGTGWGDYVNEEDYIDNQLFARLDAALTQLAGQGIEHVVLSGISMGSRLMTAGAAAWQSGIFNPSANIDLVGLIGAGMYAQTGGIPGTTNNPTSIDDFNVYDTHKNLTFINSIPVLDIYGSQDTPAVTEAGIRRAAYAGNPGQYVQNEITCPPNNGQYYAFLGNGVYQPYYGADGNSINRCHQLRDGYLADGNGGYYLDFAVRAPMKSTISTFMNDYIVPRTQVPESSSLLLMLIGLPLLLLGRRKRIT